MPSRDWQLRITDILQAVQDIQQFPNKSKHQNLNPLAQLRQSKFIGCFSGDPDLASKSEEGFQAIMNE
jgi:hypothetical protein